MNAVRIRKNLIELHGSKLTALQELKINENLSGPHPVGYYLPEGITLDMMLIRSRRVNPTMSIALCRCLDMRYTRICRHTILHIHKLYLDFKLPGFEKTKLDLASYPEERVSIEKDDPDAYRAIY